MQDSTESLESAIVVPKSSRKYQSRVVEASVCCLSALSVFHIFSWVACVTLGTASIWLRQQNSTGVEGSYMGIVGTAIWLSTPVSCIY